MDNQSGLCRTSQKCWHPDTTFRLRGNLLFRVVPNWSAERITPFHWHVLPCRRPAGPWLLGVRAGLLNLLTGVHPQACTVIGYPDGLASPVQATVQAAWYTSGHQLKFTCDGYPNGTSGSPWIINGNEAYGLIGGYQQGGATPSVSYSPCFGVNVRNLYNTANEAFL
jgi:hypothetical protein